MSQLQPTNAPVLDYAGGPRAGEIRPEVEAVIDGGASPNEIRRFFRKSKLAVQYFAESMARRHDASHLGDVCIGCNTKNCTLLIRLEWTATAKPRFGELVSDHPKAAFNALHSICPACLLQFHRRWSKSARITGRLQIIGSASMLLVFAFQLMAAIMRSPRSGLTIPSTILIGVWLAALLGGKIAAWRWWRSQPQRLKQTMPRGVVLSGFPAILFRDGDRLNDLETNRELALKVFYPELASSSAEHYPKGNDDPTGT